jgi:hypothetical protein
MRSQPRRRTLGDRLMGGRAWLAPLGFAAMAALALVVLRPAGGPGFGEVVAAAARPPLAAVAPLGSGPLLREHVESVRFPNFEGKFGWRATGVRSDRIGGRATGTVFYDRGGTRLAYTIVGGDALGDPPGTATDRGGVRLRSFTRAGRTVVTWRRQGHTCVLSATGVSRATLLELAAWKGKGAVAF